MGVPLALYRNEAPRIGAIFQLKSPVPHASKETKAALISTGCLQLAGL
jgi:hypothetical protein